MNKEAFLGRDVANKYHIDAFLGAGSFANTYLASDVELHNTPVAIKIYNKNATPQEIDEFKKEARLLTHTHHPHVIEFLDFNVEYLRYQGEDNKVMQSVHPFIVMEYANGGSLNGYQKSLAPLAPNEAVSLVTQAAMGISHVHSRGIIHRDIKPDNLLLNNNNVLLSDFGIAYIQNSSVLQQAIGTPAFMAPEQSYGNATTQSDQYSLGVVAYKLVTGKVPFNGNRMAILLAHQTQLPPEFSKMLPNGSKDMNETLRFLEEEIMKTLAKNPHERHPSVAAFGDSLERAYQRGMEEDGKQKRSFSGTTEQIVILGKDTDVEGVHEAPTDPFIVEESDLLTTIQLLLNSKDRYMERESGEKLRIDDSAVNYLVYSIYRFLSSPPYIADSALDILDSAATIAKMDEAERLTEAHVIKAIAQKYNIPESLLTIEGRDAKIRELKRLLTSTIIGQDAAVSEISRQFDLIAADLQDKQKPLFSALLIGPTGVGKTETTRIISNSFVENERNIIKVDMSRYNLSNSDVELFGTTGQNGLLINRVSSNPYSVIILENIENAHTDVLKKFLPILEEGMLFDVTGNSVNFRNTIILATSNLGAREAFEVAKAQGVLPNGDTKKWDEITKPIYEQALKMHAGFPPELLNRLSNVITYKPLLESAMGELVHRSVNAQASVLNEEYGVSLSMTPEVQDLLEKRGYSAEYGARYLQKTVEDALMANIASWLMDHDDEIQKGDILLVTSLPSENSEFAVEIKSGGE